MHGRGFVRALTAFAALTPAKARPHPKSRAARKPPGTEDARIDQRPRQHFSSANAKGEAHPVPLARHLTPIGGELLGGSKPHSFRTIAWVQHVCRLRSVEHHCPRGWLPGKIPSPFAARQGGRPRARAGRSRGSGSRNSCVSRAPTANKGRRPPAPRHVAPAATQTWGDGRSGVQLSRSLLVQNRIGRARNRCRWIPRHAARDSRPAGSQGAAVPGLVGRGRRSTSPGDEGWPPAGPPRLPAT